MKGWKIVKPLTLTEAEVNDNLEIGAQTKVKITKALINLADVFMYTDELD